MNTEKLYAICKHLQQDLAKNKTLEHLNHLVNSIQQIVNNPNDSNQQTNLANRLKNLQKALEDSKINEFSPAWRQMLDELGGTEILGLNLWETINETFQKNQITPAVALKTTKELQQRLIAFYGGIDAILNGFNTLQLKEDELEPNHSEIGFLIPRSFIGNDLETLGEEIHEITLILNSLTELISGKKQSYQIRNLSSSDPLITISSETLNWVLAFAIAVDWLLNKYKTLLEIRKLRSDLKEKGLTDQELKGVEDHANKHMKKAIDEIVVQIDNNYADIKDTGRRNELKNGLTIGFNKLVNRIDKGYNIEIRISKPDIPQEEEKQSKEDKAKLAIYNQVLDISHNIEFNKVDGESILSLSESQQKEKPRPTTTKNTGLKKETKNRINDKKNEK